VKRAARYALLWILLSFPLLSGCGGGGGLSLTGGSVPVGTVRGAVTLPSRAGMPGANIPVVLRDSQGKNHQKDTDSQGMFVFSNVPVGPAVITANPHGGHMARSMTVEVEVEENGEVEIEFALSPESDTDDVDKVTLSPASVQVTVGDTVQFTALLEGDDENDDRVSWVVEGGIGTIDESGRFTATRQGMGRIKAYADEAVGVATVVVRGPGM